MNESVTDEEGKPCENVKRFNVINFHISIIPNTNTKILYRTRISVILRRKNEQHSIHNNVMQRRR